MAESGAQEAAEAVLELAALRADIARLDAIVRALAHLVVAQGDVLDRLAADIQSMQRTEDGLLLVTDRILDALPMVAKLLQNDDLLAREKATERALADCLKRKSKVVN